MGLAKFLDKSALSASQVLKNFDYEVFKSILLSHRVCICFDKKTVASSEGFASIDLLVRILARLYPSLQLRCIDGKSPDTEYFNEVALSINEYIDLAISEPTVCIVVGDTLVDHSCLKIFIGSDQWLARFSLHRPLLSGNSKNRLGAGAAACFAAANLFRYVFGEQLPEGQLDEEFIYSTFNSGINGNAQQGPGINAINLNDTVLIGLGAIGNAVAWSLKDLDLKGSLDIVDGEKIELTNLQRYLLAAEVDIDRPKTDLINSYLNQPCVKSFPFHFDEYISRRGDWKIFRAVVCVDSANDRRLVQASLPQRVINAWTQQEQCGISRHYDFLNEPCLCCLYHPLKEEKSLPLKIAESLGLREVNHINIIRQYMAEQILVDELIIDLISQAKAIDPNSLLPYTGKSIEVFYSEVICGGVMMHLTGNPQKEAAEVPSAFESAMAGILLTAEIITDCNNLRAGKSPTIQKLNLLRSLTKYTYDSVGKNNTPDCICHDDIYRQIFKQKWGVKVKSDILPIASESGEKVKNTTVSLDVANNANEKWK
ncbi:MAG: E2 ligase fold family C protein [Chitinophagaceae bacterium]